MEKSFWLERWESNNIGFHTIEANPLLVKHYDKLSLKSDDRVFVPMCGKTLDIGWLLAKGHRVVAAELVETAIVQLFSELGVTPKVEQIGRLKHYSSLNLDVYVGDIFDLASDVLGHVDAIYDRAALVALPLELRKKYTKHISQITNKAAQLLITFEYDQGLLDGLPFSISSDEVKEHYSDLYECKHVESVEVDGGLKGKCPAKESVWLLKKA